MYLSITINLLLDEGIFYCTVSLLTYSFLVPLYLINSFSGDSAIPQVRAHLQ